MSTTNRVWVELERSQDDGVCETRAALLDKMLKKLALPMVIDYQLVWWNKSEQRYCFVIDSAGSYVEAKDNGHWFSLDFLSK